MATTDKINYNNGSATTSITCTCASLANASITGATIAGRQCSVIDNSVNLFDDVQLTLSFKTASPVASPFAIYIFFFGSEDGTLFDADGAVVSATDAAYTLNNPSNFRGPIVISCPTSTATFTKVIESVAQIFGGVMPKKWGFVVVNNTGVALDSTEANHTKQYTGIYYTNG